jgi:uncharacterized protein
MNIDSNPHPDAPQQPHLADPPVQVELVPKKDPAWTVWDVLLVLFLALLAIVVFSLVAMAIARHLPAFRGASPAELSRNPLLVVPVQGLAYVVVLAVMYIIVRGYGGGFWGSVKWNWPRGRWRNYLITGVGLAIGLEVFSAFLPIPKSLPIEKFFSDATSAYLMAVFGTTLAPLLEELFFRGLLYPVLARRAGVRLGVVFTAMLFSLIHQSQLGYAWGPLLLLFIVGLVITTVRARTGSVAAGFLIHVAYNFTLFFLLYVSTDHFRHLERVTG